MANLLKINPITRIEGHLEVEVVVDSVGGSDEVVDARAGSPMFRGFELILAGRDPRDAVHYTQRVCGVCPVAHGMAASLALEDAFGVVPSENGRRIRNLVLGANYLQSHILHFYHLALPDFINTEGLVDMSPWKPRYSSPDLVDGETAANLLNNYVTALAMRRKAHQMGALFGGRQPSTASFVPGGATQAVTPESISRYRALLSEILTFIEDVYLPDAELLGELFPEYFSIGAGCGNLLSFGVFHLDSTGDTKLLAGGHYTGGEIGSVDPAAIMEYVAHSWYTPSSGQRNPASGLTAADPAKESAYSWLKAPRYDDAVHEVGPLARMWMSGHYDRGISVMDRNLSRAREALVVAQALGGWLDELVPGESPYAECFTPESGRGIGLTEAPRGALGHWVQISEYLIVRYQLVTPTGWNASPRDDQNQPGALEQALLGTPVRDLRNPLEVLRVVHSYDPCVACSVHMLRPGQMRGDLHASSSSGARSR
ncbi:MAG: nickel-dependent hydrogenase large subunit [Planctomycetes bacterium]|nr:nickel-dependent hydrogenase large subunit [Planctomycetota bacterium]